MIRVAVATVTAVMIAVSANCRCEQRKFTRPLQLGGRMVPVATLNTGHRVYLKYCAACHGDRGDGKGPAAAGTVPPPRDFTKGYFKYKSVIGERLPTDSDLLRSVTRGVPGTRMPALSGVGKAQLMAAIHFIKTFSSRWRSEVPGRPLPVVADPWPADQRDFQAAIRGNIVYHGRAQCWQCHPAYVPREEIQGAMARMETESRRPLPKRAVLRSGLWRSQVVDTKYGKLTPPDFLDRNLRGGDDLQDIYRAVAAGIGGTDMPSWFEKLTPKDLWSVVHYLRQLIRIKGTPAAGKIRERVKKG